MCIRSHSATADGLRPGRTLDPPFTVVEEGCEGTLVTGPGTARADGFDVTVFRFPPDGHLGDRQLSVGNLGYVIHGRRAVRILLENGIPVTVPLDVLFKILADLKDLRIQWTVDPKGSVVPCPSVNHSGPYSWKGLLPDVSVGTLLVLVVVVVVCVPLLVWVVWFGRHKK